VGNKLYVGNLAYSVRDDSLLQAFSQFGHVASAKVMMDRETGRSKGFGFVEMGSDAEAQAAINGMNGQALEGRAIVVNEARPREDRPGGGGGGGFGGGGGGTAQPGDYLVIVRVGGTMSKQTLRVERKAGMAGGSPFGFEVIEDKEGGERRP